MRRINPYWCLTLGALLIAAALSGVLLFALFRHLTGPQQMMILDIARTYPGYLLGAFLVGLVIAGVTMDAVYNLYILPVKKISEQARVIYSSNPAHRIPLDGLPEIRSILTVINDFADLFENLNKDITNQILQAKSQIEKDRNLLAAIMAEMPEGVIICNNSGRILLFNSMAQTILTGPAGSVNHERFIGLGRSVFHLFDHHLLQHALTVVKEKLARNHPTASSYFLAPLHDNHLVRAETLPVLDADGRMTGFILTMKGISRKMEHFHQISGMLYAFQDQISMHDNLSGIYGTLRMDILDKCISWLPLSMIDMTTLSGCLLDRMKLFPDIDVRFEDRSESRKCYADLYSIGVVIEKIVEMICSGSDSHSDSVPVRVDIAAESGDDHVQVHISSPGRAVRISSSFMYRKINGLPSLEYLLKLNQARWALTRQPQSGTQQFTITLKEAAQESVPDHGRTPVITAGRPEFFDFDLFRAEDDTLAVMNMDLSQIRYTVFDTETTGLNPEKGDEILSIGAVRIINGRIQYQDKFEALVNPHRSIPMESYKIHGISYEMVETQPDLNEILPKFKKYVGDTVLLGHNIAFDMKMLKVKEKATHVRFVNPVLDTLLLSACLHPVETRHDMESIAARLGIDIIGRHTALGDAMAAARIYLKLIPILKSNGIFTLKNAIDASQKTYYARLAY